MLSVVSCGMRHNKSARREQNCSANWYSHPGDIYHLEFPDGRPVFFDITVCNSLQPVFISAAAVTARAVAATGEVEKDQKHDRNVAQCGAQFSLLWLKVSNTGLQPPSRH